MLIIQPLLDWFQANPRATVLLFISFSMTVLAVFIIAELDTD